MNLLQTIKSKINSIFEFYIDFDRSNYTRLFGTVAIITVYSFVLVIGSSYLIGAITNPGQSFYEYASLFGGYFGLISEKLSTTTIVGLLTYALLTKHFLSFTKYKQRLGLISCIKDLNSKKWGLYLTFLFVLSISELYPSPYYYGSQWDFLNYSLSGISSFATWSYELVQLFIYVLFIYFSYLLANKNLLRLSELKNEFKIIFTAVIIICSIDSIVFTITNGVDLYIGNFFILLDSKNLFGIVMSIIKITVGVLATPAYILALTHYKKGEPDEIAPTLVASEEVIDNFE